MTDQTAAFTVTAQTISVLVSGQPDVKNQFGPGHIRPDTVRLSYRSQHIDARVEGRWVRETGELMDERLVQHYTVRAAADIVAWPDWLCALATLLRPAVVSAPAQPTTYADDEAELHRLRQRVEELETYAHGCDSEGCVLPHSSWCERAKKAAAENDGCTCGQPWTGHQQPHAMHCWSVNPPRSEVEEMRREIERLRRMAGEEQPATETQADEVFELPGPEVVAYRNPDRPSVLLCREHGDGWWGLTPLTSEDLPDGGTCTYGDPADPDGACGVDVLIPQQPAVVARQDGATT